MKSMKTSSSFFLSLVLCLAPLSCLGADAEQRKEDAKNIETSCQSDATTAGCADKKVGKGLMKCLHSYKKDHKEFKFSQECLGAMKQVRKHHQK